MLRINLTDEDRAAFDAPEVIEYDPTRPRLKEVRALSREVGMTLAELGARLESGDLEALGAVVWMALLRSGVAVSWEDFDIDLNGTEIDVTEAPKDQKTT